MPSPSWNFFIDCPGRGPIWDHCGVCLFHLGSNTQTSLKLSETTQSSQILGLATAPLSAFNYDISSHPPAVNDSTVYGKNLETGIIEAGENFRFHFLRIR